MTDPIEARLTGGHPNSLGSVPEVVDDVLADRSLLAELYQCYFSEDEVVRLRVSSSMKRVTIEHPDWTIEFMDGLQSDIAAIDQASTQWTLALLFNLTRDQQNAEQRERSIEIMKHNLANSDDWIVLNTTMQVLYEWSRDDPQLAQWLVPRLERLAGDRRKSVATRATKLLAESTTS
ncbi:MAG: hypothetical protein HQ526_12035 [Actinobacteria bacterium]|nr:hypothetical protein [Actinomycetota bacterium]